MNDYKVVIDAGHGGEIKALLDGMQTDEELEDLNFRRR